MEPLTNEELDLDERGFPPTDENSDIDLNQLEWNLKRTPVARLQMHAPIDVESTVSPRSRLLGGRKLDSTFVRKQAENLAIPEPVEWFAAWQAEGVRAGH